MRRFTIKELTDFCKRLKGKTRPEAYAMGQAEGISDKSVDHLRILLGYTVAKAAAYDKDFVKEIVAKVEAGASCGKVAKEYGLNATTVYDWCMKLGADYKKNDFWTANKIRFVCEQMKYNPRCNKYADKMAAEKLGTSVVNYRNMRQRLKHRTAGAPWLEVAEKAGLYKCL